MLSRPLINEPVISKHTSLAHEFFVEQYAKDDDFRDVYEALTNEKHNEEVNYHVYNNILFHLGNHCTPRYKRVNVIREAHTSLMFCHFGEGKQHLN